MSVHTFTTHHGDDEIVVTMGWDRPLQGYFMTITKTTSEDEDEHFLFNNLEQYITHPKGIEGYLFELGRRRIHVPEQMISEVIIDGVNNVGNKYVTHRLENGKHVREQTL